MRSLEEAQENWLPAGNPLADNDIFREVIHDVPSNRQRFHNVMGTVISPT